MGRVAPPLDEDDRRTVERFFEAQLDDFAWIVDPEEIDVVDGRLAVIAMPKREGWAEGLLGTMKCSHDRSHQRGLAGTERSRKCDDVAGLQARRKGRRKCVGRLFGVKSYSGVGPGAESKGIIHEYR